MNTVVYRYKTARIALLLLVCAPAFVAGSIRMLGQNPHNPMLWIIGCVGILFFGTGSLLGIRTAIGLLHDDRAVILTPEYLMRRDIRGNELRLEWPQIKACRMQKIGRQTFVLIYPADPEQLLTQADNRIRRMFMRLDSNCMGTPVTISASHIRCKPTQLFTDICRYLDTYGRIPATPHE